MNFPVPSRNYLGDFGRIVGDYIDKFTRFWNDHNQGKLRWDNVDVTTLTPNANVAMAGFKLTGLGAGSANGDSVRFEQLQLNAAGYIKGTIIQTVTLISTSGTTSSGTAYTTTALSQSFTCLSSTSKVKITATGILGNSALATSGCTATIFFDSTDLSSGATGFSGVNNGGTPTGQIRVPCNLGFETSPGDTSAHTYAVKIKSSSAANSTWNTDADTTYLLLEEIAA